jgi:GNAT superfamily N-acetyltransferase
LTIIPATTAHLADLAQIHLASKIYAESGIIDADFLAAKTQEEYENKWASFLATDDSRTDLLLADDTALGFISYGQLRTPPPGTSKIRPLYSSEIFAIYVHPDHMHQGQGVKLLKHAADELKTMKHHSLCLWALEKNKQACSFYEKMEGKRIGKHFVEMGPTKVKEVCYGWRDISAITAL